MVGPVPAREEETARLSGARGDFVGSLGRRVEALRLALRAVEQSPNDGALRNGLLRRVHALSSAARVLGFASVAEALTETEKKLRRSEFADVARALDLLPSLVLGVPMSLRPPAEAGVDRVPSTWPLSVLIFGAQSLADAIKAIQGTHVECERTEDLTRAREQARLFGPDLAVIDADRAGARDLVETFAKDPLVEPVPLVVIGDFANPAAASAFIALGAARVLSKPVSPESLQRTVVELRAQAAEPRTGRDPLGELSVEALADRISAEVRRGLLEAVEPSARGTSVGFGDGADVMAAVWGAVARVRELVTLRSSGAVRFDSSGPEGAVPMAAWGNEERRAGDRGSVATDYPHGRRRDAARPPDRRGRRRSCRRLVHERSAQGDGRRGAGGSRRRARPFADLRRLARLGRERRTDAQARRLFAVPRDQARRRGPRCAGDLVVVERGFAAARARARRVRGRVLAQRGRRCNSG